MNSLPPIGPYAVAPPQTASLAVPESWAEPQGRSLRLDADLYYPLGAGPFPVLLMRQPYGRAIASTVVYAHPSWYASYGYIVVIQDVRGRGTSEGEFDLFCHEADDGDATVQWAAALPQSSGAVGMYGFSYQGMTQLYAAARRPAALGAIAPAMVGYDLHADWAYENGALPLQMGLGWGLQLAAETARRRGDGDAFQALRQAAHSLPLHDAHPVRPQVLQTHAPDSFFHRWLDHPQPGPHWQALQPDLSGVDLPMLHIGGWYDPYLRGTLRLYQQMVALGRRPQQLWIGPWGHLPWGRRVGALDFGPAANSPIDRLQIRWFGQHLRGAAPGDTAPAPVQIFVMGENRWVGCDRWPPTAQGQLLYLHSTGLAGLGDSEGQLCPQLSQATPIPTDTLVHDPWRPVPSLGGHCGLPPGPFERSAIDCRTDVLTYTSAVFEAGCTLVGVPRVVLHCQADRPSFDISAVLSEVHRDSRSFNLTQGQCRVDRPPGATTAIALDLQPTACAVAPGHRLRLSIAAACFPAYAVNSGTPAGPICPTLDHATITVTLFHGALFPSSIELPSGRDNGEPPRAERKE